MGELVGDILLTTHSLGYSVHLVLLKVQHVGGGAAFAGGTLFYKFVFSDSIIG